MQVDDLAGGHVAGAQPVANLGQQPGHGLVKLAELAPCDHRVRLEFAAAGAAPSAPEPRSSPAAAQRGPACRALELARPDLLHLHLSQSSVSVRTTIGC